MISTGQRRLADSNNMALNQGTSTAAQYQPYQNYQQPQPSQLQNQTGVRVVNQQPSTSTRFPISYPRNPVLAISIFKIIIGTLQFVFGIPNIFVVKYFTSYVAFPVWCGIVVSTSNNFESFPKKCILCFKNPQMNIR